MKTVLHYRAYGSGSRVILAFHGYGQGEGHWRPLVAELGAEVTVYAFDLFYHGRSRLAGFDAPLTKKRLGELLTEFLAHHDIASFSLLAFSMGAKFALTAVEGFAERVQHVWLIAPDGLQRRFWYSLTTYPSWMRGVLRRAVLRPQRLLRFLGVLKKRRLVPPNLVRFVEWQLENRENRLRVYRSWVGFRLLTFNLRTLAARLNSRPTPVVFFLGRYDQVIPSVGLQRFIASLPGATTVLLEAGHAGLIYNVAAYLRQHPGIRL